MWRLGDAFKERTNMKSRKGNDVMGQGKRPDKNQKRNQGSATIEMTFIMPIVLLIFYLYISLFLFFIHSAENMAAMTEVLYEQEEQEEESGVEVFATQNVGNKKTVYVNVETGLLSKKIELHRYSDSPVENIRRWQLATDTILSGGAS